MPSVKIIVAGGREFSDWNLLFKTIKETLQELFDNGYKKEQISFVSGTARGADSMGEFFANTYRYKVYRFPAKWDELGKKAGFVRNSEMAKFASAADIGILIVFWDGKSRGTKHMIETAEKCGLKIVLKHYETEDITNE